MPKPRAGQKLTDRQELFCQEYLVDLNGTQAAIRAGYSEKTADRIANQNLNKIEVKNRLSELKTDREERLQVNADWVLEQAMVMYEICRGQQDNSNAKGFLEMCGKHINVKAFDKANLNINAQDVGAIQINFNDGQ